MVDPKIDLDARLEKILKEVFQVEISIPIIKSKILKYLNEK